MMLVCGRCRSAERLARRRIKDEPFAHECRIRSSAGRRGGQISPEQLAEKSPVRILAVGTVASSMPTGSS